MSQLKAELILAAEGVGLYIQEVGRASSSIAGEELAPTLAFAEGIGLT